VTRVLITGGAGFIGSHLVDACLSAGYQVRVLDNLSTGNLRNLGRVLSSIEFIEGDLRDIATVRQAVRGVTLMCHLGALGSVPRSIEDPMASNGANVDGTLHALLAARDAGVHRFVFASSSSVYGDSPELPKHEGMALRPKSPYACSKLAAEEYCRVFHDVYGLGTIALRYFNVFGPRQDPGSQYAAVIPRFITALRDGYRPLVYGDGTQSRDFTFVRNVVAANMLAMAAPEDAVGRAYNVAVGSQVTLLELLGCIANLLGVEPNPEFTEPRPGDVHDSRASIEAASRYLGYKPVTDWRRGIDETVKWYGPRGD